MREPSGVYVGECVAATVSGVSLLHGTDEVFVHDNEPIFKAVSDAWKTVMLQTPSGSVRVSVRGRVKDRNSGWGRYMDKVIVRVSARLGFMLGLGL